MRILFTRFPLESRFGGAEVQTLSLMKDLKERGHDVAFLGSCPVMLRECANIGIPATRLDIGTPPVTKFGAISFFWRRRGMQKKLEEALSQWLRSPSPNPLPTEEGRASQMASEGEGCAIVMLSLSEKLLLTPVALAQGIRVLWLEHDRVGRWLTKNPWLPELRNLSRLTTTVVVSELSADIYKRLGWSADTVTAIPNGIDEARLIGNAGHYAPAPVQPGTLRVGTIARLTPDKGVDVLIEAVAGMPEADLTIVGTGSEEGYLRRLITDMTARESAQEPRVRLHRTVDDLGAFYRSLDVFVLPSREHDPFGLVAAEAMLCGTAVIVTDACGIASYLHNGTDALIVPANDATALRNALRSLANPAQRAIMADGGKRTAQETFPLKAMVDAYEAALKKSPRNH